MKLARRIGRTAGDDGFLRNELRGLRGAQVGARPALLLSRRGRRDPAHPVVVSVGSLVTAERGKREGRRDGGTEGGREPGGDGGEGGRREGKTFGVSPFRSVQASIRI